MLRSQRLTWLHSPQASDSMGQLENLSCSREQTNQGARPCGGVQSLSPAQTSEPPIQELLLAQAGLDWQEQYPPQKM